MNGKNKLEWSFSSKYNILICLFLIVFTFAAYSQVRNHEFVYFDDGAYVFKNRYVQQGLSIKGLIWSFSATHASNWHPLTWLSHMLDCHFHGMDPGLHHLTSLFFHMANAILLFLTLKKMTGNPLRSGFVAALFALHPLHVESVAWVSERKDVLSTFFWVLTVWSYAWYAEQKGISRYLLALLFFILGLMSKPMVVTLPFVLLLLDYWPMGRAQSVKSLDIADPLQMPIVFRLVLEKIPFFLLAAASSVVTFLVQQSKGAVGSFDAYPFSVRVANAVVSYIVYIGKMILPHNLTALYPHQGMAPIWQVVACSLIFICISLLVIRIAKQYPYVAVGWLWYIGTLVPVVGLVQVGEQAMADRYTYIPLIGLFIIMAWGVPDLIKGWRHGRAVLGIATAFLLLACFLGTRVQVGYWKNSYSLFKHALDATADNCLAHNNLGAFLLMQGKFEEAANHFSEAIRIRPDDADAHINLGIAVEQTGEQGRAMEQYKEAIKIEPDNTIAHNNLANTLAKVGRIEEAFKHYFTALHLDPDDSIIYRDIAGLYAKLNRKEESVIWLGKAVKKGFRNWDQVENDKRFDNIRQSSEFQLLMNKQ